jgi:hypothetical protein
MILSPFRYATFRYAVYCRVVIWGRLSILTVSVIFTSDPVTIQMCKVSLFCVHLCSYMGKIVHFDGFTFINPESCHNTDVQRCVMKCTVVQLYGEGWPF